MSDPMEIEKFKAAFQKISDYSAKLKPYRDRDRGLSPEAAKVYQKRIDAIFTDLQTCYEKLAFDETPSHFDQLGELLTEAEGFAGTVGQYSVKLKPLRDRAREIPAVYSKTIDKTFDALQKLYEKEDFEKAVPVFKALETALNAAEKAWYEALRGVINTDFDKARDGATKELQEQLDSLNEANNKLAKSDLSEAAQHCEGFIAYIQFVSKEKVRIEAARREEAERKRLKDEALKAEAVRKNLDTIDQFIKYYDSLANILEDLEPVLGKVVRGVHKEAVSYKGENPAPADATKVDKDLYELEDELNDRFSSLMAALEEMYPRVKDVLEPESDTAAQVKLNETYAEVKANIKSDDFETAEQKVWELEDHLRLLEGESVYMKLFTIAEEAYDAVNDDADAWMPKVMKSEYEDAKDVTEGEEPDYSAGVKHLRVVIAAKPKVDDVTKKWRGIKDEYEKSQSSKATDGQKKAAEKLLNAAMDLVKNADYGNALKQLDDLLSYIQEMAVITARRTDEDRFPNIVGKASPGGGMADLDGLKSSLKDGGMSADEVMKLIPNNVRERWRVNSSEPDRYKSGFKYEWTVGGVQYHVHGHSKDHNHDDSTNSGSGSVVRIRIGDDWLRSDGTTTTTIWDDKAHIPLF